MKTKSLRILRLEGKIKRTINLIVYSVVNACWCILRHEIYICISMQYMIVHDSICSVFGNRIYDTTRTYTSNTTRYNSPCGMEKLSYIS
jgi:hypothetical protein